MGLLLWGQTLRQNGSVRLVKRGGCWPTKPRCFRCNLPRIESDKMRGATASQPNGASLPKGRKGNAQQREEQFLGRAPLPGPQFTTAPTWRVPKKQKQAPVVVPPPVTPNTNMIEVLRGLGCSDAVIPRGSKSFGTSRVQITLSGRQRPQIV